MVRSIKIFTVDQILHVMNRRSLIDRTREPAEEEQTDLSIQNRDLLYRLIVIFSVYAYSTYKDVTTKGEITNAYR